MDEKFAMKKMVVSALAYYGLKIIHFFDGHEFKSCLKSIEMDKQKVVKEFTEAINATTPEVVEKFVRECCRAGLSLSIPIAPTELQSQFIPEPILRLLASTLAEEGKRHSSNNGLRIWATFSTFIKDYSGHYVSPFHDGKCVNFEKKVNDGVQLQGKSQVIKTEIGTSNMVQNPNYNYTPTVGASSLSYLPTDTRNANVPNIYDNQYLVTRARFFSYSPTKDCSTFQRDDGRKNLMRKRDAANHEESEHHQVKRSRQSSEDLEWIEKTPCMGVLPEKAEFFKAKRLRVQSVDDEIQKEIESGTWQENLAKEWPDIFQEMEENIKTYGKQSEMGERSQCANPSSNNLVSIEMDMRDLKNIQQSPHLEKKRKRERATDEKVSGGTVLNDSSLESIGREKDQMSNVEVLEADSIICAGEEDKNVKSEVGSNHNSLDVDLDVTGQKQNKISWPTPLYGDHTHAKSSVDTQNFEHQIDGDIYANALQVGEDICAHELQGEAFDTCPVCKRKEEIAFAKYTRLFKDDPTWKQKFLDGENLTCDICSSKRKVTTFDDVTLLLKHALKMLELRGPEHKGYAKAIHSLMQLIEPGTLRTCHSAVGQASPLKTKRVWPPVIVLENTYNASDSCSDLKDLDKEVTKRLKAFVNVELFTLQKVKINGYFQGTILVQFPPSQRGSNDANRLHQYFLLTGRSLQEWMKVQNKSSELIMCATGVQENFDLVKTRESGEIQSRIYFGYLATIKIMRRLDPRRQFVKWKIKEGQIVENR